MQVTNQASNHLQTALESHKNQIDPCLFVSCYISHLTSHSNTNNDHPNIIINTNSSEHLPLDSSPSQKRVGAPFCHIACLRPPRSYSGCLDFPSLSVSISVFHSPSDNEKIWLELKENPQKCMCQLRRLLLLIRPLPLVRLLCPPCRLRLPRLH